MPPDGLRRASPVGQTRADMQRPSPRRRPGRASLVSSLFVIAVLASVPVARAGETDVAPGTGRRGPPCTVSGTEAGELVEGTAGDDILCGFGGADRLLGHGGHDTLYGGEGDDALKGGSGIDQLIGESGTDTYGGGKGDLDRAWLTLAPGPVEVRLSEGSALGDGALGDPDAVEGLRGVEGAVGTPFGDVMIGDSGPNTFAGSGGSDRLRGGRGLDVANYEFAAGSVRIDLAAAHARGADGRDVLVGIESIIGSAFDDQLLGDGGNNEIAGLGGDDLMDGRGSPLDTLSYAFAPVGVTVDVRLGAAFGEGNDTLAGFERVSGSPLGDTLVGDDDADTLHGLGGADTVEGGGGPDLLATHGGNDELLGGPGRDDLNGGSGGDDMDGGPNADRCVQAGGTGTVVNCESTP
jgi:Ca2+-binding RTX toxin-like protein